MADLLPSLSETVWVGVSAGSMVMIPRIGASFVEWRSAPDDRTLGLVDFSIFPHLNVFPTNTLADAARSVADIAGPAYAIDDQTAIKVAGLRPDPPGPRRVVLQVRLLVVNSSRCDTLALAV